MDQRLSFVTLAVADRARSRAFYVDGLGWEPLFEGVDVLMFAVADKVVLSLWDAAAFEAEVGYPPTLGRAPITLAHNLATERGVDRVLETATTVGASEVSPAEQREWGGYSGYFADPDGYRWEIAYNPHEIGQQVLPGSDDSDEEKT